MMSILKDLKLKKNYLKGVIKNYSVLSMAINFYDQPIDSDIKRYEGKRKLATG